MSAKRFIEQVIAWNKEKEKDPKDEFTERYIFRVSVEKSSPGLFSNRNLDLTVILDEEDIEHLFKKYSPRVKAEMEAEIDKVKKSYEGVIASVG